MMISHVSKTWFKKKILNWYLAHGRHDLPWKRPITPYRVWVSEIMLQQTQVSTVIPYFEKFIRAFPDVYQLADASIDSVLHHWAGLGYYARGRNLHKSAKLIVKEFAGEVPNTLETLLDLPGIGLSTAGAILAQAFNTKATICDGNVKRVLARFHRLQGPLGQKAVEDALWQMAHYYTPTKQVADYTQAIMDIGATICTRVKPLCAHCPVQSHCQAYQQDKPENFPQRTKSKKLPLHLKWVGCLLNSKQEILLEKRPTQGIWGGLWSLPEFTSEQALDCFISSLGKKTSKSQELLPLKHSFTHFRLLLHPTLYHFKSAFLFKNPNFRWVSAQGLATLGLPTPIQKIVNYDIIVKKMRKL
ncbi:MAG: A/G-specific adenine glycosylase [Proteobacteria bacterium]|nr:A/G-specific adenine glycosylase [Pseudomonadota bacterium]